MSGVTLQDLLVVEDDPSILDFRCAETGIPLWPLIRFVFLHMVMADLLNEASLIDGRPGTITSRAIATMIRSISHNFWFRMTGQYRADVCLLTAGVGNQLIDGKWLNRLSDHFALACPTNTLTVEEDFEWAWAFPRHNERVVLLAPQQAYNAIAGRMLTRETHRDQAKRLIGVVCEQSRRFLNWSPGPQREEMVTQMLGRKVASMPRQYRAYEAMLSRIEPKILILGAGCYGGPLAPLIVAARRMGIVTAEYQHGAISAGHDAYNFAPTIRESPEYRETLPEHFLGYGDWWNDQINVPVTKTAVGNPYREARLAQTPRSSQPKEDILILSDYLEFPLYLDLAEQIASSSRKRGLRVVLRAHPQERGRVQAKYGDRIGEVSLDKNEDLYASLSTAHVVISGVSTGLFEAAGLADKIFMWDTPKSRFTYPRHPFQPFSSASMFLDLLSEETAGRLPASELDAIWAPSWRDNYLGFLEGQGVRCTQQKSLP
jgi:hypothetical protein